MIIIKMIVLYICMVVYYVGNTPYRTCIVYYVGSTPCRTCIPYAYNRVRFVYTLEKCVPKKQNNILRSRVRATNVCVRESNLFNDCFINNLYFYVVIILTHRTFAIVCVRYASPARCTTYIVHYTSPVRCITYIVHYHTYIQYNQRKRVAGEKTFSPALLLVLYNIK